MARQFKSTCWFCRGPGFSSQELRVNSTVRSVTPVLGAQLLLLASVRLQAFMGYTHIHEGKTLTHKIKILKKQTLTESNVGEKGFVCLLVFFIFHFQVIEGSQVGT